MGESLAAYLQPKGEYYNAKKSLYQWAPGTKSQYSNVGVALAAYLAETKAKISFETLCPKGIFEPLGMHGYLDFPSGTLRVTAPHLARFHLSLIGDGKLEGTRILKAETVREMRKVPFPKGDSKQRASGISTKWVEARRWGTTAVIQMSPRSYNTDPRTASAISS